LLDRDIDIVIRPCDAAHATGHVSVEIGMTILESPPETLQFTKAYFADNPGGGGETRAASNPAFGTNPILKGNLASRQVPFFREISPSG